MWRCAVVLALPVMVLSAVGAAAHPDAPPALQFLDSVSCVSAADCLAVGDQAQVVATTDAGTRWSHRSSPPDAAVLTSVECLTASRCLATGDDRRDSGEIYLTLDGGTSWRTTPASVPGGFFNAVSCASDRTCVAVGSGGAIARTRDGGASWTEQTLASHVIGNDVDCPTTLVCQTVGYQGSGAVLSVALRSLDGGRHWTATPLPDTFGDAAAVDCTSVQRCVAVGEGFVHDGRRQVTRIFVTHDSGASWRRRPVPHEFYGANGISCPSEEVCFSANYGADGILASRDRAATWTPEGPEQSYLHDVACTTTRACFAVGELDRSSRGVIFATTDGGRRWHRQPIV